VTNTFLIVRFSSLGDVVLVSPVFSALKKRMPDAHITLLTRNTYAELHRSNPDLDAVWSFEPESESLGHLSRKIRDAGFQAVIDLHGSIRSRIVTFRSGSAVRRHRKQSWRRLWLVARPPLKRKRDLRPVVDRYLEATGIAAPSPEERVPRIFLPPQASDAGREWRDALVGNRPGRLVALLPGAKHSPKEWPVERFAGLADLVVERGDVPVVIPPPGREELGVAVAEASHSGRLICSEPLDDAMALAGALSAVDGLVANDSGPMHLSAAVDTPVAGLFGPTSPALGFAPTGPAAEWLHLDLSCSPCSRHGQAACWRSRRYCLEDLSAPAVANALYRSMEEGGSRESP
jgi:heptosyltransferase-2